MPCSSGCLNPGTHSSYGECLRSKRLEIGNAEVHKFASKQTGELNRYVDARKAGMQPETTRAKDVLYAEKRSESLGRPFRADKGDW